MRTGVPQDSPEAVRWFRLSAAQGQPLAQFHLGVMYAEGNGIPQDFGEAVKWYRLSAAQGNIHAQHNIGVMYE
jgi:TPR repeat protein